MNPASYTDWEVESWCQTCDDDTEHECWSWNMRGSWFTRCRMCGRESELHPDDFED